MKIEVWAPNADAVSVVTFGVPEVGGQEATVDERHPLDADDTGRWLGEVDMTAGTQYLLELRRSDETWRRLDPLARAVTSSVGRSIATDPVEFDRRGFTPAPVHEWVIYELHTGTFGGDLRGVAERLDHVAELGANVIELLPLGEFAGDVSWGYNPALPFAVESSYGGPDALRELVGAAHDRHRRGVQPPRAERPRSLALRRVERGRRGRDLLLQRRPRAHALGCDAPRLRARRGSLVPGRQRADVVPRVRRRRAPARR